MLTVPANELIAPFHDRMPATMTEDWFAAWLDPKKTRPAALLPLLAPYPADRIEMFPVSDHMNRPDSNGPERLDKVSEPPKPTWTQPSRFDDAA